jgi:hypothetical protein
MHYLEQKYKKAEDLIGEILVGEKRWPLRNYIFRGEDSAKYKLLPSSLRENRLNQPIRSGRTDMTNEQYSNYNFPWVTDEYQELKRFYSVCNRRGIHLPRVERFELENQYEFPESSRIDSSDIWIPDDLLEIAALAQHYGLPTRLLDWSHDFLTALYFASTGAIKRYHDRDTTKAFDSEDFIVVWALDKNHSVFKRDYGAQVIMLVNPPYHRNPNLAAQTGVFTHTRSEWEKISSHLTSPQRIDVTPLDARIRAMPEIPEEPSIILYKLMLPVTESNRAYELLRNIGVDASRLFPGLEGIVKAIKELDVSRSVDWPFA